MEIDPATISTGPITILRRGLSFYGDRTTETTALKLDWPANSIVMLGTDLPQIFQYLKEYIDSASIAGAVPASTTAAGIVVEASQSEVNAFTATKVISAVTYKLFAPLDKLIASISNYGLSKLTKAPVTSTTPTAVSATDYQNDYAADAGSTDTYAITLSYSPGAYAAGQKFTFKANTANTGAATLNVNSLGAVTIKKNISSDLDTGDIQASQIVSVIYDGTNFQLLPTAKSIFKFGGTGADGALTITSGTTTIDLGSASYVVKNYTSISITGTGALAFSNPSTTGTIIILKCQGVVILTSSAAPLIDLRSLGGTGGAGYNGANGSGTIGSQGISTIGTCSGGPGGLSTGSTPGGVGFNTNFSIQAVIFSKIIPLFAGAGGGGGGCSTGSVAGAGGRGAGGLYIECGGAFNFTTASGINASGAAGSAGSGGSNTGGGGGGAGGSVVILYNSLTAASGTIVVTGGSGGAPGNGSGAVGGGGGAGARSGNGSDVDNTGGGGATGYSLMASNTEFF